LAEQLGRELGYWLLSREELLTKVTEEYGISESQVESALKYKPGLLEGRGLKKLHYVACMRAALARAVQRDNVVYHGAAGHVLLGSIPHHLRVRVVADMEYRIAAVQARFGLTRDKAVRYIETLDKERDAWLRWVYGADANDPHAYDLVVNLEHVPVSTACAIIAEAATRDFRATPASQKILADLALASELRARIGLDRGVSDERIGVEAENGVVTITADVRRVSDAERTRELAAAIPGVREVRSDIAVP
jgi:hypothetical protein